MPINLDIKVTLPGEETPAGTSWPVKPFVKRPTARRALEVYAYNLATKRDANDVRINDPLFTENTEEAFAVEIAIAEDGTACRYFQNNREVNSADLEAKIDFAEKGEAMVEELAPLKILVADDYTSNEEVWPIGCEAPDLEITLLSAEGAEVDRFNYNRYLEALTDGIPVKKADDDDDYLVQWSIAPFSNGHVAVSEKTSGSTWTFMTPPSITAYEVEGGGEPKISYFEGVFFNKFDTSDTDNYKVTIEPDYTADEWTDTVVSVTGNPAELRLIMVPRKYWHFIHRKNAGIHYYSGIWTVPPFDQRMDTARKTGTIGFTNITKDGAMWPGAPDWGTWRDATAQRVITLDGDTATKNHFHVLCTMTPGYTWSTPYYRIDSNAHPWPVWEPTDDYYTMFDWWYKSGTDNLPHSTRYRTPFHIYAYGWNPLTAGMTLVRYYIRNFSGSVPDGKVPHMFSRGTVGPDGVRARGWDFMAWYGTPDLDNPEVIHFSQVDISDRYQNRESLILDTADYTETDGSTSILNLVFDNPTLTGWRSYTDIAHYVSVACAKAGDLVGIVISEGQAYYVWRKVDEVMEISGDFVDDPALTVSINHIPECTFTRLADDLINPHNGMPDFLNARAPLYFTMHEESLGATRNWQTRKIRKWGTHLWTAGDDSDPIVKMWTNQSGTQSWFPCDLGVDVLPFLMFYNPEEYD